MFYSTLEQKFLHLFVIFHFHHIDEFGHNLITSSLCF